MPVLSEVEGPPEAGRGSPACRNYLDLGGPAPSTFQTRSKTPILSVR
jgi:hypothetical protein